MITAHYCLIPLFKASRNLPYFYYRYSNHSFLNSSLITVRQRDREVPVQGRDTRTGSICTLLIPDYHMFCFKPICEEHKDRREISSLIDGTVRLLKNEGIENQLYQPQQLFHDELFSPASFTWCIIVISPAEVNSASPFTSPSRPQGSSTHREPLGSALRVPMAYLRSMGCYLRRRILLGYSWKSDCCN